VARRYLWTRVVAENGLPLDTYVPSVVTDGETDRVDPDFDREYPLRHFKLANPYWRYYPASVDDDYGCNRVQWGSEDGYSDWLVRKKAGDPDFKKPSGWPVEVGRAGCVGGTTSVLLDVGHQGGGFAFSSTNGCSCLAVTKFGSSGALVPEESWDCLDRTSPPLRAVYDVAPL
jgi:hypothetical protein